MGGAAAGGHRAGRRRRVLLLLLLLLLPYRCWNCRRSRSNAAWRCWNADDWIGRRWRPAGWFAAPIGSCGRSRFVLLGGAAVR